MANDVEITVTESNGRRRASSGSAFMFVTDISRWEEVGAVHGEMFGTIRPATTIVEVTRLIDAAAFVEIEADAIIASS